MPTLFLLDLETAAERATLRLRDHAGDELAHHEVVLAEHALSLWAGLFDTRRHVKRLANVEASATHLARLGAFLGEKLLGPAIAGRLAEGEHQRTVLVRLPAPEGDDLAAALARVPWELAIAPGDHRTLLDRHVVVRAAPAGATPADERAILPEPGKPVRVLLVFAEAAGSRPLAMRQERERLREMFFREVLPVRDVEIDVLCHGVTRSRLRDHVRDRGGYHVVHWSGHGHVSALEIALEEGEEAQPWIEGEELLRLLSGESGLIPAVVFLSACHSGSLRNVKDWASFQAPLGDGDEREGTPAMEAMLRDRVGFTGAALALVQAGVKQVVAMRYEVGDRYARELGVRFYKRLLAGPGHPTVDAALAMARGELKAEERPGDYDAVDHATPLVLGREMVRIEPPARKSAQMAREKPNPSQLLPFPNRELDPRDGFVGRGAELTKLWQRWMVPGGAPIALIQGLAGMGKTSLAAEAIHLWFDRFDHVLCFQAKGQALSIEDVYRRVDQRLRLGSSAYRGRLQQNEMGAVYLEPGPMLKGAEREEAQRENLVEVLGVERILLVVDNFETILLSGAGPEGYAAQDPEWDRLFEVLGDKLRGTGSRVVVTSRHKMAALANPERAVWVVLSPLPVGEARLYFEGKPALRGLLRGNAEESELARKILNVSRGHPLILDRIGDLARVHSERGQFITPAGRLVLQEALGRIQNEGYKALPDVFAASKTHEDQEREHAYLHNVVVGAVDWLIERLSELAQRVLWTVTRAAEPVPGDMITGMLGKLPATLVDELIASGLLHSNDDAFDFHELVAERATDWMNRRPAGEVHMTEAEVWKAYGMNYREAFAALAASAKREQASEAGQRAIGYLVKAGAFDVITTFASEVVTRTYDTTLLHHMIADLRVGVAKAPPGSERCCLRTDLADALRHLGQPDMALVLYNEAAEEASISKQWPYLVRIYQNWANALVNVGEFGRAREAYYSSAEMQRRVGSPRIDGISTEFEALRVEVKMGRAEEVSRAIGGMLDEVRDWWARWQNGEAIPGVSDRERLGRSLVSGLSVAFAANMQLERWQCCMDLLDEIERVTLSFGIDELERARTRFNRYGPLSHLGPIAEAKTLVDECLDVFRRKGDVQNEARALSALADISSRLSDPAHSITLERSALAIYGSSPLPAERAASHNNLAAYLKEAGLAEDAKSHRLAAVAYGILVQSDPTYILGNLAACIRLARDRGEVFALPPLADILATAEFAPLRDFLAARGVPWVGLQSAIDRTLEKVCSDALTSGAPDVS